MTVIAEERNIEDLREVAHPLTGARTDYDPLLKLIGDAKFVLLGEATHGTHEFYKARAEITKRLIQEKGFTVIAWEADWPDALRINRYIQGRSADQTALESLGDFKRFPSWMWRNADILDLVGWLRSHNDRSGARRSAERPRRGGSAAKVGVYGLDLYVCIARFRRSWIIWRKKTLSWRRKRDGAMPGRSGLFTCPRRSAGAIISLRGSRSSLMR